jgi:hypothetical protein
MKLKQITLITTIGIATAFAISLINFPWKHFGQNPRIICSFIGMTLMYASLLFFFISLYRRS